ncbi:zinc-binding dehydrogenase, partial [Streptomyces lavendulae]|uniref:zinc-binding dehydrogenase n=1 Tax=Streptomyces lavendulae TaxID=1914 RepID=UPI0036B89705
ARRARAPSRPQRARRPPRPRRPRPRPGRPRLGTDRQLRAQLLSPFVRHRLCGLAATPRAADLVTLAELIDSGAVTPAVDRSYPLDEVPEAIRHLRSGAVRGKLVIRI